MRGEGQKNIYNQNIPPSYIQPFRNYVSSYFCFADFFFLGLKYQLYLISKTMPPLPVTSLSISFPVNLLAKAFNTFCINFIIQFNFFLYRKPFPVPALLLKMLFNIRKFLSGKFRIRSSLLFHLTFLENLTLLIILSQKLNFHNFHSQV